MDFLPARLLAAFDNLEEQVQSRLAREFSDIVVETLRRELYARAGQLTGVPLARGSGDLQMGADCQSPVPQNLDRRLTAAAEDLPEFVAVADYVGNVERLDGAVQSFLSLQYTGGRRNSCASSWPIRSARTCPARSKARCACSRAARKSTSNRR